MAVTETSLAMVIGRSTLEMLRLQGAVQGLEARVAEQDAKIIQLTKERDDALADAQSKLKGKKR